MKIDLEKHLQEYIYNLCETEGICVDCRFACFGDENKFYTNNDEFSLDCVGYYAKNFDDMKQFFADYLNVLWKRSSLPNRKIALYIEDITKNISDVNSAHGWYDVYVGGALFNDDSSLYKFKL